MDIVDDLQELAREGYDSDTNKEKQKRSKLRKVIIISCGIVLILFTISLIATSYPLFDIIKGQLESVPWQENKIALDNLTIIFEEEPGRQLSERYLREQKVEFSACLMGETQKEKYLITSLYFPEQSATFSQVSFEPCKENTLIMLHSHPYKSCLASETDIRTLEKSKEINPDLLMVVMCEPERFSVYS